MQKTTVGPAAAIEFARPLVTVDVAILTLGPRGLQALLVQRPGGTDEPFPHAWALPGGFVDVQRDADLHACALRKLGEKTAVSSPYLEQVGSWGGRTRDPRGWSTTCVYFALLPQAAARLDKGGNAADVRWFDVKLDGSAPEAGLLAFDHGELLAAVLQRLQSKVEYTSLPAFLLPEPFTLPQLQGAYEAVLGRPLDRSAFRRRALTMPGFLREAGVIHTGAPRAPQGYALENRRLPVVFPRTFEPRSHP
jgi:8-oxo-dGTP diphosphatase